MLESTLIGGAVSCYALVGGMAATTRGAAMRHAERLTALALIGGIALHTLGIAVRWVNVGHGPFTTMHEALSSNLWSLALIYAIAWWSLREVRAATIVAWPIVLILAVWLIATDARPGHLPATYATLLLYLHALVGKLFLGLLLVALALATLPALRRTKWGARRLPALPEEQRLDTLAYRFSAFAFVFDTLTLIVGAIWAQDAWGRYWGWDALETWSFLTWLALAATLHARATFRPSPTLYGLWLGIVFVIAFLTFFGVPFLSASPHKGAI